MIKIVLNEATAYSKRGYSPEQVASTRTGLPPRDEKRKSFEFLSKLDALIHPTFSKDPTEQYFVSFTQLEKLGINPSTRHKTPVGIYSYGLNPNNYTLFKKKLLPFATKAPLVQLFKIKEQFRDKILVFDFDNNVIIPGNKTLFEMIERFVLMFPKKTENIMYSANNMIDESTFIDQIRTESDFRKFVVEKIIEDCNDKVKDFHIEETQKEAQVLWTLGHRLNNPSLWSSVFIKCFGICGVIDNGCGIIHPNEKSQSVFFNSSFIEPVETILNPYQKH